MQQADILLVDDDAAVRDAFTALLQEEGFNVATAIHGEDALRYLATMPQPRLIILDLMMTVMDGWQFLEVQREHELLRAIPVVVLSAQSLREHEAAALNVALYLRKPVNVSSLLMIAESYCRPEVCEREAQA